jgi:hypothetical protein
VINLARAIKPGGWVESQEFDLMVFTDDDTLPSESVILKWCRLMNEGGLMGGFKLRLTSDEIKAAMQEAGFTDITVIDLKLPIGIWTKDLRLKEAGKFALVAMLDGLQGISLAIFTRFLKWQVEEVEVLLAQVRNEWKQRRVHSYWPM